MYVHDEAVTKRATCRLFIVVVGVLIMLVLVPKVWQSDERAMKVLEPLVQCIPQGVPKELMDLVEYPELCTVILHDEWTCPSNPMRLAVAATHF